MTSGDLMVFFLYLSLPRFVGQAFTSHMADIEPYDMNM